MWCEQGGVCLILYVCVCVVAAGPNLNTEFTYLLPAGSTECFYQSTERNGKMEVEYQVIAGAGLSVGFTLTSPIGSLLGSDFRGSDALHKVEPTEEGDYQLCFDNSFSRRSEKMVYVKVAVRRHGDYDSDEAEREPLELEGLPESLVDYKLEDIRARMEMVWRRLEASRQLQVALRASEARDRYLLEDNLWRVSFWSCVSLLVMLTVAVTQIYTLQCLFHRGERLHT